MSQADTSWCKPALDAISDAIARNHLLFTTPHQPPPEAIRGHVKELFEVIGTNHRALQLAQAQLVRLREAGAPVQPDSGGGS
ncbi:MAG: hypothetical protein B7733_06155 [Myxococcales bacterium FL481]|nr:MAG: hypothetical protein B7733_06155 [Myxococcales bacterium FL481]